MATESHALVTGGLGFIGSRLCTHLLRSGFAVTVLDDLSVGSPENLDADARDSVRIAVADVRDVEANARVIREARPDVVIHLAAVHFIPSCERDPRRAIDVNVTGTQALLDACSRRESVQAVVLASSGAVYEPATHAHAETDRVGPTDIYGFTKNWLETIGAYFHSKHGIAVRIARIFNAVGPGETNPHLLPAIIEQIRDGERLRLGNLTTRRDYVASDDVARGLVLLARPNTRDGVLTCNLGSEVATSGEELVRVVAGQAGRTVSVEQDAARIRESDRPVLLSDCRQAREVLEWRAETSLEDAIASALDQPFAKGYLGSA